MKTETQNPKSPMKGSTAEGRVCDAIFCRLKAEWKLTFSANPSHMVTSVNLILSNGDTFFYCFHHSKDFGQALSEHGFGFTMDRLEA